VGKSQKSKIFYNTGTSEHITNNKDILTNLREEKIIMKCANNSLLEFNGVGTYEGNINGYYIKLDSVFYSKDINKNLFSGIKLASNRENCSLKRKNKNIFFNLKIKNKNKKIINLGKF